MGKSKLWFAATLMLAILTGFLVWRYLSDMREPPTVAMTTQVVASTKIAAGTRISSNMVEIADVPVKYAHPSAASDLAGVVNLFALVDVYPGEVVPVDRVAAENTVSEISYKIPKGLRALTVPVNALSGVGGLLKPGHRVDVLVTYTGEDPVFDAVAATVVQDVLVLAVGQDLIGGEEPQLAENVTLALTPADAEMVALGELVGRIKLSARPVEDTEKPYMSHMTVDRMIRLYP